MGFCVDLNKQYMTCNHLQSSVVKFLVRGDDCVLQCHVDIPLINMHEVPKISATRSWLSTEDI